MMLISRKKARARVLYVYVYAYIYAYIYAYLDKNQKYFQNLLKILYLIGPMLAYFRPPSGHLYVVSAILNESW